jgi:hypothetical protein
MAVSAGSDIFWVCDADSAGGDAAGGGADWVDMAPLIYGAERFILAGLPIQTALQRGPLPCGGPPRPPRRPLLAKRLVLEPLELLFVNGAGSKSGWSLANTSGRAKFAASLASVRGMPTASSMFTGVQFPRRLRKA